MRSETAPPAVPGILTTDEIVATARSIAAQQEASGAIPWFSPTGGVPGHVDAWNHVEAAMALSVAGLGAEARRAYEWLRGAQRPDGSWPAKWVLGEVTEPGGESNHAAYVAVGVWHELLTTGDERFARHMWRRSGGRSTSRSGCRPGAARSSGSGTRTASRPTTRC